MPSAPAAQSSEMWPRWKKKSRMPKTRTSTAASAKKEEQRREAMETNSGNDEDDAEVALPCEVTRRGPLFWRNAFAAFL